MGCSNGGYCTADHCLFVSVKLVLSDCRLLLLTISLKVLCETLHGAPVQGQLVVVSLPFFLHISEPGMFKVFAHC